MIPIKYFYHYIMNYRFHTFNASRTSESVLVGATLSEEELFARPSSDSRAPRGWLVDLINRFGVLGGFQALLERFQTGKNLTLSVVYALIRPFGMCYEFLTVHTVTKYLMPVLVSFYTTISLSRISIINTVFRKLYRTF